MWKSPVFYVDLKSLINSLTFLFFHEHFQKQLFEDVIQNKCSKNFCVVLNSKESPAQAFACEYCKIVRNRFF